MTGFKATAGWFDVKRVTVKHHVAVTVKGSQVTVRATDIDGNLIDSFSYER